MAATVGLLGVVAVAFFGLGSGGTSGGDYEVRGIFDNGGFLVPGEEVRIAGARVGTVASVDITRPDERVHEDGSPDPGKAVVVMRIDDEGFQDFRQDASCLIRPQSLLGEKYVDCEPTQPRAPASEAPPPLETIPEGEPGAGQRFLPLERNGKQVDLDLVQNIMREPFADRFRLILNDLGAGLAARGKDLAEIVRRSDPALRETDQVLAILARQNRALGRLAADSDAVLAPLARERRHVSGFINHANATAQATAERGRDLEAGLQRFPGALHQLRLTMIQLRHFADQSTPVFADLGAAAPSITRATKALGPFAHAATPALTTLGDAAQKSTQPLVRSDPILVDVRDLARTAQPGAKSLARLLASLRETKGFDYLTRLVFFTAGSINAFDSFGHFLRAQLPTNNCVDYETVAEPGCSTNFVHELPGAASAAGTAVARGGTRAKTPPAAAAQSGVPLDAEGDPAGGGTEAHSLGSAETTRRHRLSIGPMRDLLDAMIGPRPPGGRGEQP